MGHLNDDQRQMFRSMGQCPGKGIDVLGKADSTALQFGTSTPQEDNFHETGYWSNGTLFHSGQISQNFRSLAREHVVLWGELVRLPISWLLIGTSVTSFPGNISCWLGFPTDVTCHQLIGEEVSLNFLCTLYDWVDRSLQTIWYQSECSLVLLLQTSNSYPFQLSFV